MTALKLQEDGMIDPSTPAGKALAAFMREHLGVRDRVDANRYAASLLRLGVDEIETLAHLPPAAVHTIIERAEMRHGHAARLLAHVRASSELRLAWLCDGVSRALPRGGLPGCLRGCLALSTQVTKQAAELRREVSCEVNHRALDDDEPTAERAAAHAPAS